MAAISRASPTKSLERTSPTKGLGETERKSPNRSLSPTKGFGSSTSRFNRIQSAGRPSKYFVVHFDVSMTSVSSAGTFLLFFCHLISCSLSFFVDDFHLKRHFCYRIDLPKSPHFHRFDVFGSHPRSRKPAECIPSVYSPIEDV